jgi:methyl-accepting chemotaxis protein
VKFTISKKIVIMLSMTTAMLFIMAIIAHLMNTEVRSSAESINDRDIPKSVISLSVLDELGDMNSNILEYVLGEAEEKADFEANYKEFKTFFAQLQKVAMENRETVNRIELLSQAYYEGATTRVFDAYIPENEFRAQARIDELTENQGKRLESLLDELKEAEIADAGTSGVLKEIVEDDLPGVRYYLELVDEVSVVI